MRIISISNRPYLPSVMAIVSNNEMFMSPNFSRLYIDSNPIGPKGEVTARNDV